MRPDFYENILKLAKTHDKRACNNLIQIIKQCNDSDVALTIKHYPENGGLSDLLFKDIEKKQHVYSIKGPLSKGLDVRVGKHVAFAAGTGILVFVDLVAHLILKKVAEQGGPEVLPESLEESVRHWEKRVRFDTFRLRNNTLAREALPKLMLGRKRASTQFDQRVSFHLHRPKLTVKKQTSS